MYNINRGYTICVVLQNLREVSELKIDDIRKITQMSQRQFAEHFGIPVGTLRNWEQGIAKPPDYVFQMIISSIRRDKMINIETINNAIGKLAAKNGGNIAFCANKSKNGIVI